jgi:hypothetical protein
VLNGTFGERTRAAIVAVKGDLPFQYEEQKSHEPTRVSTSHFFVTSVDLEYNIITNCLVVPFYKLTRPERGRVPPLSFSKDFNSGCRK